MACLGRTEDTDPDTTAHLTGAQLAWSAHLTWLLRADATLGHRLTAHSSVPTLLHGPSRRTTVTYTGAAVALLSQRHLLPDLTSPAPTVPGDRFADRLPARSNSVPPT